MADIRAVIFDMDGTLLDSREFIYRAFEDVLGARDITVTREEINRIVGKPVKAMYAALSPSLDTDEMELRHFEHHAQNMELLRLYDGAVELLEALQAEGYKLGIFTGINQIVHERLGQFKIDRYFESIVDTTRYTAHKPDPEGLLLAMRELGVTDPAEVVYVGDGITDMGAGVAAKARAVIGITHGFCSEATLREFGATHTIDSLPELLPLLSEVNGGLS